MMNSTTTSFISGRDGAHGVAYDPTWEVKYWNHIQHYNELFGLDYDYQKYLDYSYQQNTEMHANNDKYNQQNAIYMNNKMNQQSFNNKINESWVNRIEVGSSSSSSKNIYENSSKSNKSIYTQGSNYTLGSYTLGNAKEFLSSDSMMTDKVTNAFVEINNIKSNKSNKKFNHIESGLSNSDSKSLYTLGSDSKSLYTLGSFKESLDVKNTPKNKKQSKVKKTNDSSEKKEKIPITSNMSLDEDLFKDIDINIKTFETPLENFSGFKAMVFDNNKIEKNGICIALHGNDTTPEAYEEWKQVYQQSMEQFNMTFVVPCIKMSADISDNDIKAIISTILYKYGQKRCIFIGKGWGCNMLSNFAQNFPRKVKSLLFLEPNTTPNLSVVNIESPVMITWAKEQNQQHTNEWVEVLCSRDLPKAHTVYRTHDKNGFSKNLSNPKFRSVIIHFLAVSLISTHTRHASKLFDFLPVRFNDKTTVIELELWLKNNLLEDTA